MIRALGALQGVECGGMVALPFEPAREPRHGLGFGLPGTLDSEWIASGGPSRAREPLAVASLAHHLVVRIANRDLLHHSTAHPFTATGTHDTFHFHAAFAVHV